MASWIIGGDLPVGPSSVYGWQFWAGPYRSRSTVGATLLLFVLLLPRLGSSQVFDGLPITEQERHWFADIPACLRTWRCFRGRQLL